MATAVDAATEPAADSGALTKRRLNALMLMYTHFYTSSEASMTEEQTLVETLVVRMLGGRSKVTLRRILKDEVLRMQCVRKLRGKQLYSTCDESRSRRSRS